MLSAWEEITDDCDEITDDWIEMTSLWDETLDRSPRIIVDCEDTVPSKAAMDAESWRYTAPRPNASIAMTIIDAMRLTLLFFGEASIG